MKRIAYTAITILIIASIGGIAAYYLARKYEPEVRDILVYEVNRMLNVEVSVRDINLSLLQRFPYASLRFSDVVIPETHNPDGIDTLLYANDVYLQISLWDFLRKQYRVSEAEINGGFIRMKEYGDGVDNYHFWKASETADPSLVSLQDIEIRDFTFGLKQKNELDLSIFVEKAHANGMFGSEVYDIGTDCSLNLIHLAMAGETYYSDLPISGSVILGIDHVSDRHELNTSGLKIGKEKLHVKGTYDPNNANAWHIAMHTTGARIENIIELLPVGMRASLKSYKAKGKSDIAFEISDADNAALSLDMLFDDTKGSFQHDVALGKAVIDRAAGSLQLRGDVVSLYIDHIHGSMGPGKLKIQGSIRNFNAPVFDLGVDGSVDLREVRNFFALDYLDEMNGKVSLSGTLSGKLPTSAAAESVEWLRGISFDGNINLKDGSMRPKGSTAYFEKINGDVSLRDNAFHIQEATANVNGNEFAVSGKISNVLPYLMRDKQKLSIIADFRAGSIDFNRIWNSSESKRDTSYQFSLPEQVSFDFGLEVGEVTFRKFTAQHISGRAVYNNHVLQLKPIIFKTASGSASGAASVKKMSEREYTVQSQFLLKQMNISQLFHSFENFGQEMVTDKHIMGLGDAHLTFQAKLRNDLSIDAQSIVSQIELEIVKGKLKNVQALADVADYLRGNLVWKSLVKVDVFEKKLAAIDFDTLRNTIDIRDRMVRIPSMRIGSSALTLNLSGTHDFDNNIDYRLSFRLSELFRTGKPRSEEFGYIVDDLTGLRLFLQMSGTVDDPVFGMDKDGARQKRKDDFQKEKSTFKGMLKDEFGLFKSDSSVIAPQSNKTKGGPVYQVEWEEGSSKKDSVPSSGKKPSKKRPLTQPKANKDNDLFDVDDDL